MREGFTAGIGGGVAAVPAIGVAFPAYIRGGWGLQRNLVVTLDYNHLLFLPKEPTTPGEHLELYAREALLASLRYWPEHWLSAGVCLGVARAQARRTVVATGTDPSDAPWEGVDEWSPAGTISAGVEPFRGESAALEIGLAATAWKWDGLLRVDVQLVGGVAWYPN